MANSSTWISKLCYSYTAFFFASKSNSFTVTGDESLNMRMPINNYRFWFNALKEDNADTVSTILSSASVEEKNKLLNGVFDFVKSNFSAGDAVENGLRKPLSVCIFYDSFNVLSVLLKHDIKVDSPDNTTGDNVLHVLVKRVLLRPLEEELVVNMYK